MICRVLCFLAVLVVICLGVASYMLYALSLYAEIMMTELHYHSPPIDDLGKNLSVPNSSTSGNATRKRNATGSDSYIHFGSFTPYSYVRGNFSASNQAPRGCTLKQTYMIIQHGVVLPNLLTTMRVRYRLSSLQSRIVKAFDEGKGELTHDEINLLSTWSTHNLTLAGKTLTEEGERDLIGLGKRFAAAFPYIITEGQEKENSSLEFFSANYQYIVQSGTAFISGLLGGTEEVPMVIKKQKKDVRLEFPDLCYKYMKTVATNTSERTVAYRPFKTSPEMMEVFDRVATRLGITLTTHIPTMYDMCRYLRALHPNATSPWCVPFTVEDLKVLEYMDDLKSYSRHGYRHPINYEQACPVLVEVIQSFRDTKSDKGPKARFFFVKAGVIPKVLAYMGLFKDTPPLGINATVPDRLWRASNFSGFASNLGFFIFKCGSNNSSDTRWWVSATINEKPLLLPKCKTSLGCLWNTFLKGNISQEVCNFDAVCENRGSLGVYARSRFWEQLDDLKNTEL
ncbi:multiple inositol polyphosphate phosphatase 1-like isoform X2 [Penaeus japonicus]|uniref:multiple inositol polyphosphate phosphatase 1-like isoform X2 n=1 Tax=Penaeus japonicus TaxID=27405 RepID=UPI001C70D315|nr:multiple inositol polyphosphate phosphatase 1-like isoform X2 [Penaeus japonicus]